MLLGIKAALLQRGLSQRELSKLGDIPENRLSTLINGWRTPSPDERRRLSTVLRTPEAVLFASDASIEIRSSR